MAWTTNVDYPTSTTITAAIWNGLLGATGNQSETAPAKVTTAGDLIYGTGANAIARLGVGSAAQLLKVNSGATAPEWGTVAATEITAANWKLFYSNGSGAVQELALAASGVLTANGVSAAPTFEAAGGDTLNFTANGGITAGNAAVLDADGKASAAANTQAGNAIGSTPFTQYDTTVYHTQVGNNQQAYDVVNNVHVLWAQDYDSAWGGFEMRCITSNSSDNTYVIQASNSTHNSSSTTQATGSDTWWDTTGQVGLFYHKLSSNNYPYVCAYTTSGSGTGTSVTTGADATIQSVAMYGGAGCYVDEIANSIFVYGDSSGTCVREITPAGSASTSAPTIGAEVVLEATAVSSTEYQASVSYDATNKKIVVIWRVPSSTIFKYVVGTASGSSITWGTAGNITTSIGADNTGLAVGYRSVDDKWLAIWSETSDNELVTATGTLSGTTVTWAVKAFISSDLTQYKWNYITMNRLDDGLARATIGTNLRVAGRVFVFTLGYNGTNYVPDATTYPRMPDNASGVTSGSDYPLGLSYSPDSYKYAFHVHQWVYGVNAGIYQPVTGSDNTSYTIGVAQTTVTDGQTVEVKSIGTTTTTGLSGLTVRDKMYVQGNGTISSTSSTEEIGIATAADTVLLTKIGTALT